MGPILFTGITVCDLLLQIKQIIKTKISILPRKENLQSGYLELSLFEIIMSLNAIFSIEIGPYKIYTPIISTI